MDRQVHNNTFHHATMPVEVAVAVEAESVSIMVLPELEPDVNQKLEDDNMSMAAVVDVVAIVVEVVVASMVDEVRVRADLGQNRI